MKKIWEINQKKRPLIRKMKLKKKKLLYRV